MGSGKPIREWLYVEDGATALIKSIHLSEGHNFLNVGVKKGVSIIDLAYKIKEKLSGMVNLFLIQVDQTVCLKKLMAQRESTF